MPDVRYILSAGPFAEDDEHRLLTGNHIDTIVAKNSGGDATYGKIAAARRFLNNAVAEYNAATEQFPGVLVARLFGFSRKGMFDLGESRQMVELAPAIKF